MSYTPPPAVTTGQLATASDYNTYVKDNIIALHRFWTILDKSGTYAVTPADVNLRTIIQCTGTFVLSLPAANNASIEVPVNGLRIVNIGTGVITLTPTSPSTIIGAATFTVTIQYQSLEIIPDSATNDWRIF